MFKLPHIFHSWRLIDIHYSTEFQKGMVRARGYECDKCQKRKVKIISMFANCAGTTIWKIHFLNRKVDDNIIPLRVVK